MRKRVSDLLIRICRRLKRMQKILPNIPFHRSPELYFSLTLINIVETINKFVIFITEIFFPIAIGRAASGAVTKL